MSFYKIICGRPFFFYNYTLFFHKNFFYKNFEAESNQNFNWRIKYISQAESRLIKFFFILPICTLNDKHEIKEQKM